MKLIESNRLVDLLLIVLFFASLILSESKISFFFFSIGLIGCLVLRFKPNLLSPYFFLAPASIYLILNLLFIYINKTTGYLKFFSCAFIGLLFLSLALKHFYKITTINYKNIPHHTNLFVLFYCFSISLLTIISVADYTKTLPVITKIIQLTIYPVAFAVCFGSLLAIASRHLWQALALSILFLGFTLVKGVYSYDFSRLSVLDYFLLIVLCILFGIKKKHKLTIFDSKFFSYVFIFIFIAICYILFNFYENVQFGGDVLIVENAIKLIQKAKGKHEYLMPIYNGGLIFVPDFFWPESKPKLYNSSAWFITNVMKMKSNSYPWGVGVSLFASSYLYGGLFGVAIIFYSIGVFFGKISRLVINSFWAGFFIYFSIRLPFSILRMDETFLFGSFIPMILVMVFFIRTFKQKINKIFDFKN